MTSILVVDDEAAIRLYLRLALDTAEFSVHEADDGHSALAAYGQVKEHAEFSATLQVPRLELKERSKAILDGLPVVDFNIEDIPVEEGIALLCMAKPTSNIKMRIKEVGALADIPVRILPTKVAKIERLNNDVMKLSLKLPESDRLQFLERVAEHVGAGRQPQRLGGEAHHRHGQAEVVQPEVPRRQTGGCTAGQDQVDDPGDAQRSPPEQQYVGVHRHEREVLAYGHGHPKGKARNQIQRRDPDEGKADTGS